MENTNRSQDILIDFTHVGSGVYLIRKNARQTFQDAKFLYKNKKFQNAIPLFIISLEESLKSHILAIKFRKKQFISVQEWANLQTHKYKLSYVSNFAIENMESMNEETAKDIAREYGDENLAMHTNEIIAINKAEKGIESHFQKLKELCLYQNWNKEFNEWDEFDRLNSEQKEDLAYFVMKKAELHLQQLDATIEFAVNVFRRDGLKLNGLDFPTYNEFRKPVDFETRKTAENVIDDYFKYYRGLRVFESLMVKKAFALVDQVFSKDLVKKCLKLPSLSNLDNWYPHPVVKSIFNAMAALKEGKNDGHYAGISGDADLTKEGKPLMTAVSIISKKDQIIKIEKIMINGDEYSINDKVIEQIMKTEIIIDAEPGKEIPLEKMHLTLSKIGLKMRKLKDDEIQPAIDNAHSMIEEWKINISDTIKRQIKLTTVQNWDDQDPNIRIMIGMCYYSEKIKDRNTIVMTGQYDPLEKFKVRGMIYGMLVGRNKMGLSTD